MTYPDVPMESAASATAGRRDRASYSRLFKDSSFTRFFVGQSFSSLGDWIGLLAILALVKRITNDEFAVAAMLLARFAPALLFGPVAGVLVDRWNRKYVMVACDLGRAGLVAALPFIESVRRVSPVLLLLIVSAMLETMTLMWQPAKDAAVPTMVPMHQLTHANSLVLFAAYGTFPLSGAAFGLLVSSSRWVGAHIGFLSSFQVNKEHLPFFFDSFTFLVSAVLTTTLLIPRSTPKKLPLNVRRAWREVVEGLRFVRQHPRVRPWILGIGMIYVGIGAFLSLAVFFVSDVLRAGSAGFGLLVTAAGIGLGLGFGLSGTLSRLAAKDLVFSSAVFGLGAALIGFGSVSTLSAGAVMAFGLGLGGGFAYPAGLTLVQESVGDEIRGRILASMHSSVRLALVGSLGLSPILVKLIGNHHIALFGQTLNLTGTRSVLWLGGVVVLGAGVVSTGAVRSRWRALRMPASGLFVVFEGGEGAGKTTQIERLARLVDSAGRRVTVTREPGSTAIGERIREVLLDRSSRGISSKAEALLYAADRAQHVDEVVRPALERGDIVISDRYLDSSVAYQGVARGLGMEEVREVSRWATGGLFPDLVFLLDFEPERGLERSGATDRMEDEDLAFHERVRAAYRTIAERYPERFVTLDASKNPDEIAAAVAARVEPLLGRRAPSAATQVAAT